MLCGHEAVDGEAKGLGEEVGCDHFVRVDPSGSGKLDPDPAADGGVLRHEQDAGPELDGIRARGTGESCTDIGRQILGGDSATPAEKIAFAEVHLSGATPVEEYFEPVLSLAEQRCEVHGAGQVGADPGCCRTPALGLFLPCDVPKGPHDRDQPGHRHR